MNEEVRRNRVELLVKALESGDYEQTNGTLHRKMFGRDFYCCLGVACRVAQNNGADVTVEYDEDEFRFRFDGEPAVLPESVRDWYGFPNENPHILVWDEDYEELGTYTATKANDSVGLSFEEIAKGFRRTYLGETIPQ